MKIELDAISEENAVLIAQQALAEYISSGSDEGLEVVWLNRLIMKIAGIPQ